MAARLNPKHDEQTREKIQTSQLVNRLQSIAKGEVEGSQLQVKAAEILLRKTLPDLSAVSVDGKLEINPVQALLDAIDGTTRGIPKAD